MCHKRRMLCSSGDVLISNTQRNDIAHADFTLGTKVAGSGDHVDNPMGISDATTWNASRSLIYCDMNADGRKKLNVGLSTEVTVV